MQMVNLNFKCKCYSRVSAVRAAGNDATGRRKCEPRRGEGGGGGGMTGIRRGINFSSLGNG